MCAHVLCLGLLCGMCVRVLLWGPGLLLCEARIYTAGGDNAGGHEFNAAWPWGIPEGSGPGLAFACDLGALPSLP